MTSPTAPNPAALRGISHMLAACLVVGTLSGYLVTFFSLAMEAAGTPTHLIGYANSAQLSGILAMSLLLPRVLPRSPLTWLFTAGALLGAAMFALLASLPMAGMMHIALRFLLGCAMSTLYIVAEYWLNSRADDAHRGKTLGMYGTLVVMGMGIGPLLVPYASDAGSNFAMQLGSGLFLLCALPVLLAPRVLQAAANEPEAPAPAPNLLQMLRRAPVTAITGLTFGIAESSMFGFMPITGLRSGFGETESVFLLTCILWGGMVMHIPAGWLADRIPVQRVLLMVSGIGAVGGMAVPSLLAGGTSPLLWAHMVFWGGTVTTIYTTALIQLGRLHQGASLASAGLTLVLFYGIGGMLGPTLAAYALEWHGTAGLPWLMALACGSCFVFTALHRQTRSN